MALVEKFEKIILNNKSNHSKVNCTYAVITDDSGEKFYKLTPTDRKQGKLKAKKAKQFVFLLKPSLN